MKVKKEKQKGRFEGGWKKKRDLYLNDMYLNKDTNLKLKSQTLYGVFFFLIFIFTSIVLSGNRRYQQQQQQPKQKEKSLSKSEL